MGNVLQNGHGGKGPYVTSPGKDVKEDNGVTVFNALVHISQTCH